MKSVRYSLIVNHEVAVASGQPLSPYLHITCAEGLSTLVKKAESGGHIHGIKVASGALIIISHLLFVDDFLLFFRASLQECEHIKNILNMYERASSQALNLQKSEACYSRNVDQQLRS